MDKQKPHKPVAPATSEKILAPFTHRELKEFQETVKGLFNEIQQQVAYIPAHYWPEESRVGCANQNAYQHLRHTYLNGLSSIRNITLFKKRVGSENYKSNLETFRDRVVEKEDLRAMQSMVNAPLSVNHLTEEQQMNLQEHLATLEQTVDTFCSKINAAYPQQNKINVRS